MIHPTILRAGIRAVVLALVPATLRAQVGTAPDSGALRLTLGDAVRLAARQSVLATNALSRVDEARARVTQRRAELLPSLSTDIVQSGRTFNTVTFGISFPSAPGQPPIFNPDGQVEGPVNTIDLRARLQSSLFDYGALARVRSARTAVDAARADADNAAELAGAQAAEAYVRALRSTARVSARIADSTLAAELVDISRRQLDAGVGVALDVTRARSQLAGARAQLILARSERDRARLDLRRALNVPLDAPIELADSLRADTAEPVAMSESDAIDRALRERPDLRAADEQLRAAAQTVASIRAERLPSVHGFVDDGVIGKNPSRLLPTYTYGLQLSFPLFDGFRRSGRIAEQQAMAHELEARRRDLRQQAAIEVRAALQDLASGHEAVDAARERLRLAEDELAQARERFRAGVAGNADVVTASLALNGARSLYVDALSLLEAARVSFARAEGDVTRLP